MPRRLYRSRSDRMVSGVCGGLGEYFDLDPVLVRLIFVLLALAGPGIPAYIILWIIIPEEERIGAPVSEVVRENVANIGQEAQRLGKEVREMFRGEERTTIPPTGKEEAQAESTVAAERAAKAGEEATTGYGPAAGVPTAPGPSPAAVPRHEAPSRRAQLFGAILVLIGLVFLLDSLHLFWWVNFGTLWPLLLILIGVVILWLEGIGGRWLWQG